jgi:hypothetical protein
MRIPITTPLWALLTAATAWAEVRLESGHAANRLDGIEVLGLTGDVLSLEARRAGRGLLVLASDQPLVVDSVRGAEARLKPGWDGTLGYGRYGLELSIPAAGRVSVRLRSIPPPKAVIPTSDGDLAAFLGAFRGRPSRFPDNPRSFVAWRREYRQKLAAWLMGGRLPDRVPLAARTLATEDFPKFTLRRVEYRSRADRKGTLLLALPKGRVKAPLLLALHGHEAAWGEADPRAFRSGHADDFCAYFAERGWAVLQPATMDHVLQHPGETLQGQWTWDAMVALDYALGTREADAGRVAVCGLSTGGHLAMNVLALDGRVRAGVVGCVLSTWNHCRRACRLPPHCDCGIGEQLAARLETCDWAALAAPKPVQFQHGRQDACFCPGADPRLLDLKWNTRVMPVAEFEALLAEVRRAYRLAGRPEAVVTTLHNAGHRVDNEAAFRWLDEWSRRPPLPPAEGPMYRHTPCAVNCRLQTQARSG